MQSLYTRIDKTSALLQPTPVEPHERQAAGHDEDDDDLLAFESWDWNTLLIAVAICLIFWAASIVTVSWLIPYLIVWLEA